MQVIYDGSFEGLLCALDEACADAGVDGLVPAHQAQLDLFSGGQEVSASSTRAAHFAQRLRAASSRAVMRTVLYNYLSELAGFEDALLAYVRMAFARGADIDRYHAHDAVRMVHACARKVGHELHRLTGLARFRELRDGRWWAPLAPDHNVVCGVAAQFRRRMPSCTWIVYDVRRGYGVRWDTRAMTLVTMHDELSAAVRVNPHAADALYTDTEHAYQRLWRHYFQTISIAARRNPSLQRRNMPQRYWRYLIEEPGAYRPKS